VDGRAPQSGDGMQQTLIATLREGVEAELNTHTAIWSHSQRHTSHNAI
jgi:hypothetical protein